VGTCGVLEKPDDKYGIMVPLDNNPGGKAAIEVFDPLCPACKGFENRLFASGLADQVNRKAVLFPLDDTCNWMVKGQLHPGACAVSEAILCAAEKGNGKAVIEWGFEHQEEVRAAAKSSPTGAAELLKGAFPDLASCIGSKVIQNKLNRSLRWAVDNNLPVLTPQFYVENQRMCDEDTDLGLDFALSRMLSGKKEAP
jgi:protein-disulfide isomerase